MADPPGQRVLFLASSAPRYPGDATAPFILNMARDLCALGWRVDILAPHAPGASKKEIIDGVTIYRFQYLWPASWQRLCYNGGAAINLKRNRLNALAVPFLVIAELLSGLSLLLRRRHVLVHSHWVIPQGVIGQLLAYLGVAHVISVHGADIYGFRGRLMRAMKGWALRRCGHVVANSSATKAEIEAICLPRSLSVIPTGTTPFTGSSRRTASERGLGEVNDKVILFVGRLIEAKGVRHLIDALPRILARQNVQLLIVGDGPDRPTLEAHARTLGIQRAIRFVGAVPHSRIYDYFLLADVFVGPSIDIPGEWTEAQGNTFVEALFARVPVVATRVGGIPDAIVHERTGLLVDEREPAQLAQAVLRIFSDEGLAEALREAGYSHAVKHFSRLESARKLDGVYRSVLGFTGAA